MDEFDRDVLRVGGRGSPAEREQTAATQEPLRHLLACTREPLGFAVEQPMRRGVAREEPLGDESLKVDAGKKHIDVQHIRGSGSPTSMSTTRVPP